jgi:uncharacterized protein (UPF0276 family)
MPSKQYIIASVTPVYFAVHLTSSTQELINDCLPLLYSEANIYEVLSVITAILDLNYG